MIAELWEQIDMDTLSTVADTFMAKTAGERLLERKYM